MLGVVPTVATMYWRLKLPETPRYTLHVKGDMKQASEDVHGLLYQGPGTAGAADDKTPFLTADSRGSSISEQQSSRDTKVMIQMPWRTFLKGHGRELFGCCSTWFLLDIAFYSQNLFQPDVLTASGWVPAAWTMDIIDEAFTIAKAQAIVALCSTVPGYWFTVAFIETIGRFWIQVMGFVMMTIFMVALASDYPNLRDNHVATFVALYSLCFFFANFGPNSTTFVIPSELFPSSWRSTAHGISAAFGKLGAIIGSFGFGVIQQNYGLQACLSALAVVNFLGLLCTYYVPETKGKSLEELAGEGEYAKASDE